MTSLPALNRTSSAARKMGAWKVATADNSSSSLRVAVTGERVLLVQRQVEGTTSAWNYHGGSVPRVQTLSKTSLVARAVTAWEVAAVGSPSEGPVSWPVGIGQPAVGVAGYR